MKTFLTRKPALLGAVALTTLAACGGGGGGATSTPVVQDVASFQDAASAETSDLIVIGLNANDAEVGNDVGTLNRSTNTLTTVAGTATVDDDRTTAVFDDGIATFDGDDDAAAVRFVFSGDDENSIGIIGVATAQEALPAGTATYTGTAVLTATSGTDVYDLTGTANVTAAFGANTPSVTSQMTDLSGTLNPAAAPSSVIADAGTLTITGSTISENVFTNGTASLTSSVLSLSDTETTTTLEGGFFGEDADEAGGVFIVTDGTTTLQGDFLAD